MKWIFGLAAVALIFVGARTVIVNIDPPGVTPEKAQVDRVRTMAGVRIKGVAPDSNINYTIESPLLKQFMNTNISELQQPYIVQSSPAGMVREVRADFAEFNENTNQIILKGNAQISTKRSADSEFEVVKAQQYTISLNSVDE